MSSVEDRLKQQLGKREQEGSLRKLSPWNPLAIDLSSNDYLGLSRCPSQLSLVQARFHLLTCPPSNSNDNTPVLGASGSRLLSGDSRYAQCVEEELSRLHNREKALLFNSGYDANLSVLSSLLLHGDVAIVDEYCHNSLFTAVKISRIGMDENVLTFRHNDVRHLETILSSGAKRWSPGQIWIVVESVYSMDGDVAPLKQLCAVASLYNAKIIVDDAHGLGVYGKTNPENLSLTSNSATHPLNRTAEVQAEMKGGGGTGVLAALGIENHPSIFCSIHTFGKAAGCHGAVVVSSRLVIDYLINYARPFIYSTSLPLHSLVTIKCAYDTMTSVEGEKRRRHVFRLVSLFQKEVGKLPVRMVSSPSPIQAVIIPENEKCVEVAEMLRESGFSVFPIRSPTVPKGLERIRVILHAHNSEEEVKTFVKCLSDVLERVEKKKDRVDFMSRL